VGIYQIRNVKNLRGKGTKIWSEYLINWPSNHPVFASKKVIKKFPKNQFLLESKNLYFCTPEMGNSLLII